jgi:hypothetical protein
MEVLSSRSIVSAVKPPAKDKEPAATAASSSSSSAKDKEKEKEKETSESPAPPDADADPADAPPPQTLFVASGSGSVPAIPGFKWGEGKSVDNGEERRVHCARTVHAAHCGQSEMTPRCGVRVQSMECGSGQRADTPGTHPCLAAALADDAVCNLHTSIFVCIHPPAFLR